ncbi:hypothetical protein CHS0354_015052 [Potamilus streckersoni]|uniref:Mucin-like protein n=1 Tax=Potamilus streckersoni TaxID=2493646 RepID=A0AAE0TGC2_9BIVA|nr:hypothetical protein CHS0354_015052 [Potamilus streckersoni]
MSEGTKWKSSMEMILSIKNICVVAFMLVLVAVKAVTGSNTCVRACILGSDGRPTNCTDWLDRNTSTTTINPNFDASSATVSVFSNASTSTASVLSNASTFSTTNVHRDTPTFSTSIVDLNDSQTPISTRVITNTVISITNGVVSDARSSFSSVGGNAETSATENPAITSISSTTSAVRSSLSSTARSATTVSTNLQDYNFLYGTEYGDSTIRNVDDYCEYVPNSYHDLYVCSNGLVSLSGSYVYYTPSALTGTHGLSLVAPYHSDIDLRCEGCILYYHFYDTQLHGPISNYSNVRTAEGLVKRLSLRMDFTVRYLLIVTWDKVQHFPAGQNPSQRVSFQLVFASDGANTYAVYKYFPGQMNFSGNYDVFIGYLLPPDIYVQHSLSFATEAFRIDQHVQTQGIRGVLLYQLKGERIDTTNEEAFNYGTEHGDQMFGDVDDRCVKVENTYIFPLFNNLHSEIYVCSNGIVTIDGSHVSPNLPSDLNSVEFDILMPYFTDIELKHNGVVYYQVTDVTKDDQFKELENVIKAESYIRGIKTNARYFEVQFLLVVTWHRVTPYPAESRSNETMSFQLVLVSDGLETYVLYIYFENEMNLQENNAVIGYMTRPGRLVQHLYSSTPFSRNVSSLLRTRNRRGAIFYELTEFPNEDNVFRHTCIKWYARNNAGRVIFNRSMSEMPDCPCTLDFLQRDRRFTGLLFSQGDAQCSYMRPSWWFRPLGVGKTCCYGAFSDQYFVQAGSYAGGFIRYSPWFFNNWHIRDDLQMREYCCEKTDLCNLYRALRPIGNCYTTFPVSFANFWGDPHIETLDGRKYTFNGYGEYTMLTLNSGSTNFILQARTSRAQKANGNFSDATIFSAFAVKDDRGVQAHVELNSTKTGLLIFTKTGSSEIFDDYTMSFASEESLFAVDTENGSFLRENNRTAFTAVFSSGIFLTITLRLKMLSISVGIPSIFRGQTKGLLGNFDGDITNDFICANGTQLNNTITDREIFQFGESWTINGPDSVFRYPNGKHSADYSHRDFMPKFIDEADPLMVANATNICGEENQECIFDLVFTENEEVANETLRIQMEAETVRRQIENVAPYIEGPAIVEATINTTLTYTISGTDDGMIAYRFQTNDIGAKLQLNESCGAFVSFTMSVDVPIELRVIAEDNNGVVSNLCEPTIVFCSGCNNHGVCDFTTYRNDNRTTTKFKYARCICNPYWSGSDCDEDFDSCADSPCSALRTCTDYPPTVHQQQGIGYSCSNCPGGYSLSGDGKCIDIDECSTTNGGCEQTCQNTQGSYQCSCFSMFRIQSNGKTCKDIDECEESLSDCDHICLNTNGSYNCSCFPGFEYNVISRTCVTDEPPSVCSNLNCSNSTGCTIDGNGNATCFCKIGYHLSSDGSSCEDNDECIQNTCEQICTNTPGSFQCRCYAGFQMDNDKLTCKPCQPLTFGENCSQVCECSQGAERCDPVRGCICRAGWTGLACESDVNECRNPNICRDVLKSCANTNGSYACTCVDGYTMKENNVCSDVDECNDPELDVCEQECVNTAGGFYCTCEAGFIIDPQNNTRCKDIDECTNGQSGCKHICENTPGRFSCDCYYGYRLTSDRKTCEQVENPCATLGSFNCSQICVVTDHSSFCSCNQGYQLLEDSQSCKDINECSTEPLNQCSHQKRCLNNEGGYTCSCDIGFRLDKDGRTCHNCDDFHYGPDCSIPCNCGVGAVTCDPVAGCVCKNGWRGEKCTVDRNECNSIPSPCAGANALCINTNGSYICACKPGFRNTSIGCEDINECEDLLLNDCEQVCVNNEGSYTCNCELGFLQDEHNCHDINECAGQNNCSHSCENTHGGYRCACNDGFKLNHADKRTCLPKTLCQREAELACRIKGALCVEKHDTTECYCEKGYAFSRNETCEDLNECENNTCQEICYNIPGGYICSCNTGKTIARDGKTCTDCTDGKYGDGCNNNCSCNNTNTEKCSKVTGECTCMPGWQGPTCNMDLDECLNNSTCPKDSVCINTKGSYLCICQAGFMMTVSGDCMECDSRHFGADCTQECTCIAPNTETCDKVAGNCTCIESWAGQSCELKVTSSTTITTKAATNVMNTTIKTTLEPVTTTTEIATTFELVSLTASQNHTKSTTQENTVPLSTMSNAETREITESSSIVTTMTTAEISISSTTQTVTSPCSSTAIVTTTSTTTQDSDTKTTMTMPVQMNFTSITMSSIKATTITPEETTTISITETTSTLEPTTNSSTSVSPEPATSSVTITRTTLKPTILSSTAKEISTPETATESATTTSTETLEPTSAILSTVTTSAKSATEAASIMSTSTNTTAPEANISSSSTTNTKIHDLSTDMSTAAREATTTLLTTTMSTTPEQATIPTTKTTTRRLTQTTSVTLDATNISSEATISASHEPFITRSTSTTKKTSDATSITSTTTTATTSEVIITSSITETPTTPLASTTTSNANTTTTLQPSTMPKNTTSPISTATSSTTLARSTFDPTSTSSTSTAISVIETKTKSATTMSTEGTEPTATVSTTTTTAITEPTSIILTSANTITPGATIISSSTTNTSFPDLKETISTTLTNTIRELATTLSATTISTSEQTNMPSTTTTTATLNQTTVSFTTTTDIPLEAADASSKPTIASRPEPAITSSSSVTTKTSFPTAITSTTMIATPFDVTITSATKTAITAVPTTTPSNKETTATFETPPMSIPISTTTSSNTMIGTTLGPTTLSSTTTTNSVLDTTTKSTAILSTESSELTTMISTKTTTAIMEPNSTISTSTNTTSPESTIILSSTINTKTPNQTTNSLTAMTTTIREPTTTSPTTFISTTSELATILSTTATTTTPEKTMISSTTIAKTTLVVTYTSSSTTTIPATLDSAIKSSTLEPGTGTVTWNITSTTHGPATSVSTATTTTTTTTPGPTTAVSSTKTMTKIEASTASSTTATMKTFKPNTTSSATASIKTSTPTVTSSTLAPISTVLSVTGGNNTMTITTTPGPTSRATTTTTLQSTKTTPVTEVKTTRTPIYSTTSVSNITSEACQEDSFGSKCENECQCKRENSANPNQTCSPTNGTCICKRGWTGDCGEDIDECAAETNICHDKPNTGCHNLDGGYRCSCLIGFEENKNGSCVDAAGKETTTVPTIKAGQLGTRCSVTFNIQISVSINLNVRETYNHYEYAVRVSLEVFFASFLIQSSVQITVTSIRRGSLIVDYVLILENNEETKQQLTKAFEHLASGEPVSIDGKNATAKNLSFGNVSITNGTVGLCFLYQEIYGGCPDSYECLVENQVPACRQKKPVVSDSSAVIIGVGVGIPICILSIVLVVLAMYLRKRKREKSKYLESEHKTYSFDLHRMTTRFKGRHGAEDYSFFGQWPNYSGSQRTWNEC